MQYVAFIIRIVVLCMIIIMASFRMAAERIRLFEGANQSNKFSNKSNTQTTKMPPSVSTNRTLRCVKVFCLTGISMLFNYYKENVPLGQRS